MALSMLLPRARDKEIYSFLLNMRKVACILRLRVKGVLYYFINMCAFFLCECLMGTHVRLMNQNRFALSSIMNHVLLSVLMWASVR